MNVKPTVAKTAEIRESVPDDLKTAYQVHTLIQMLTMRLAALQQPVPPAPYPPFVH